MLSTNVGNLKLSSCFLNASGPRTITVHHLSELDLRYDKNVLGGIVTKSFTLFPQPSTPKPNVNFDIGGSINKIGLENKGLPYFLNSLNSAPYQFDHHPLIISIADPHNNIENLGVMVEMFEGTNWSIEINLSCHNTSFFEKQPLYNLVYELNEKCTN